MTIWNSEVALVTGAGSGIGRATALAFAAEGARVIASDLHPGTGEDTVRAIRALGGQAEFVLADVSIAVDAEDLIAQAIGSYGQIDFAFNNAGVEGVMADTVDCTEANWDRTLAVNLKGVWLCMKYELQHMRDRGRGVIVNCASVAGLVGLRQFPAYVASKHGVVGLTRAAALEHAKAGVRINAVCPGVIHTPMVERIEHEHHGIRLLEGEPVGRMGTPEEVADAVVWLCSNRASFVTGHALAVDGGWVAQ